MSEPTLRDVLAAIARIEKGQAAVRDDLAERIEALDEKVEIVRKSLVSTRRDDVRDLRDDVDAIHKGLMKAKPHDVPKELPSQVRAKGERSSKPAKRTARRR